MVENMCSVEVKQRLNTLLTRQNSIQQQIENKPTYAEMCRLCDESMEIANEMQTLKRYLMFVK